MRMPEAYSGVIAYAPVAASAAAMPKQRVILDITCSWELNWSYEG
jgi:hypothetical protein